MFWVSALPHFDFSRWALNIGRSRRQRRAAGRRWLVAAVRLEGALAALPFAVWLFLAIEQLPLAAEESSIRRRDMPKGIISAC